MVSIVETRPVQSTFESVELRSLAATPIEALSWAWDTFGERCCVLASMQDATTIELAMRVAKAFPVVFLDTGYHFDETWETLRAVEARYEIEVEVIGPLSAPKETIAPGACCDDKATLLERALRDRSAWVSGVRRHQTENRANATIIEADRRNKTKLNPIAQWSDRDHATFVKKAQIIRNPLLDQGYRSIGCQPCTSRPSDADDPRSGRWAGMERTECGLHL